MSSHAHCADFVIDASAKHQSQTEPEVQSMAIACPAKGVGGSAGKTRIFINKRLFDRPVDVGKTGDNVFQ
jgi:hypothetical protein